MLRVHGQARLRFVLFSDVGNWTVKASITDTFAVGLQAQVATSYASVCRCRRYLGVECADGLLTGSDSERVNIADAEQRDVHMDHCWGGFLCSIEILYCSDLRGGWRIRCLSGNIVLR